MSPNGLGPNALISLSGARIWLACSAPDTSVDQVENFNSFIRLFAREVFKSGGHIVHGAHPSVTPILLEEARGWQSRNGRKDCLLLAVSQHWSKDGSQVDINEWRKTALVYETPEASGPNAKEESLAILRSWMAARSDAIVIAGGRTSNRSLSERGIPRELEIAEEKGLPCFVLGGLGGAASVIFEDSPHLLSGLKNGLRASGNRWIYKNANAVRLVTVLMNQLANLPLVRGVGTTGVSFRILALDGGGIKGAFTASAIATWEQITGMRAVDHFDLIAGTSTGGILALGLGIGLSGREMLEFYKQRGPVIFPVTSIMGRFKHKLRHVFCPKYSQETLLKELENAFYPTGIRRKMKDSQCRLLIPSYHAIAGAPHQFRTPHCVGLSSDAETEIAQVALATAAAPSYFSAARVSNQITENHYIDGGVWANSPVVAAIIEAVCFLGVPIERIDVLSVGTTDEPFTVKKRSKSGLAGWLREGQLLKLLMSAQQESSLQLAKHMVSDPRFLRVNRVTVPGAYSLDSSAEIGDLAALGNHEAQKPEYIRHVSSRFLNGVKASPW